MLSSNATENGFCLFPQTSVRAVEPLPQSNHRLINATERAFLQRTVRSSCEHVFESKKATESVAREKTYIRGTRAISKLVFVLHVGALVSALPSSAPRKSDV